MPAPMTPTTLEIGTIVAPHGIRGGVRIALHNRDSRALKAGMHVHLVGPRRRTVELLSVEYVPHKGQARVVLRGVDTRDAAELLRGARVEAARDDLPPLEDDEFYLVDTLSRPVSRRVGDRLQPLGKVVDILSNGEQDLFEVEWADPRGAKVRWLMPILPQFIETLGASEIVVDLPEGMLPEELETLEARDTWPPAPEG